MTRLERGDTVVLFAEGTSSDGNRVLPFKTSLFGAVIGQDAQPVARAIVQTAAVVYTSVHGIPVTRADRPRIGWYGDMEMTSHAWGVLKSGPITVTINVSEPVPLSEFRDRKDLALKSERTIRRAVLGILRGRPGDPDLVPVEPSEDYRRGKIAPLHSKSQRWT